MDTDLESLYKEAQSALKAKDYDRASDLLRQILKADVDYKDAAHLLARAIRLSRRRWYNDPRTWGGLGALLLIGLGFYFFIKLQDRISQPVSSPVTFPTDTPAPTIAPPATITTTATSLPAPTPVPLTWRRVSIGQEFERDTVTAITIDPNDSEVLYVGMKYAGIYKSIDGGISWHPSHFGLSNTHMQSLSIDPHNPHILYAGTMDGIYKTEDGGETWLRTGEGTHVLMDPQDSTHLYARNNENIYESTNQGKSWESVYSTQEGCPDRIRSWAIHPVEGRTLFIVGGEECEPGLYLSSDGGNKWTLEEKGGFCAEGLSIGLDRQGNNFFVESCGHEYSYYLPLPNSNSVFSYWDSDSHLYKQNWNEEQRLVLGQPDVGFVTILAISPDDPDTLYAGGEGLSVSRDAGLTWTKWNDGLGSGHLQLDASTGNIPILYIQSGGCNDYYSPGTGWDKRQSLYISSDLGSTWDLAGDTGCSLTKDADGSTLYRLGVKDVPGGESYGWIWRSRDAGRSWEKMITPERVITLSADTARSGLVNIYVLQQGTQSRQQYVSEDYGHTWKVKEPPTGIKLCYGSTLQLIDQHRPMAIDPRDGNHVLVIDNGALLESHNSCNTTTAFEAAPNTSMNSIAFDPKNPGTLYAGTDDGAYVSFDFGQTWNQINNGLLGATVVYSIAVDKESNVYAATPYGIFKLESR